ncbi:MAG TPA: AsmA-like C-terminal domain-containing protein, partial [Thermodesulfovibrionales bacterium]|nr:AsmA-like C-terminal domain-containing protein [Thermodesulfovibrionales bacterium]
EPKEKREDKGNNETWDIPVKGILRLRTNSFAYDKYTWMPLNADISLHRNDIDIAVTKATLCGISSPGTMNVASNALSFDFQFIADNQELEPALVCLFGKKRDATGKFNLKARIKGREEKETVHDSLEGDAELVAKDGRIFRQPALLNMFSFLEVNQILRGFPEIRQEGFGYHSIKMKASLRQNTLEVKELTVDGATMKIAAQGTVDLKDDTLDAKVLISPLKKTDFIIKKTPIIGSILGGSLVSIPLRVSGDMEDPKVSYHPVSAVGSGLLGIMERTIKAPVKLFDPFLPDEKK